MIFYEVIVVVLNLFAFFLMYYDKRQAKNHQVRIPEKMMVGLAVIGGSAGIWFGMKVFRHKTKHILFSFGIPLIISLQVAALLYFIQR